MNLMGETQAEEKGDTRRMILINTGVPGSIPGVVRFF
jgi:hypothetical protein